jgi:plastocyanin
MKKLGIMLLPLLLMAAIAAAGCGKTPGTGNTGTPTGGGSTVTMGSTTFVQQSITVTAGTAVQFVDPTDTGGVHILCFGHNQTCAPNTSGPAGLNDPKGVQFSNGDTKSYTFSTPGTYEVTCTIHANMNVTITVQ